MKTEIVRRSLTISISVVVESAAEMFASDVLRKVEEAIYSGLEHSGAKMVPAGIHDVRFSAPIPVWGEDD